MKWPWRKPTAPQADPLRIAVLEYELFGIEPKPGTAAAMAVGCHALGQRSGDSTAHVQERDSRG